MQSPERDTLGTRPPFDLEKKRDVQRRPAPATRATHTLLHMYAEAAAASLSQAEAAAAARGRRHGRRRGRRLGEAAAACPTLVRCPTLGPSLPRGTALVTSDVSWDDLFD